MGGNGRLAELQQQARRSATECATYGSFAVLSALTEVATAVAHTDTSALGIKNLGLVLSVIAAPGCTFYSIRSGLQYADANREITAIRTSDPEA